MIVTIHQPDFLPWLGFFDRWGKSDLYIVLDDVQFLRRGWHHRDKIKTVKGVKWLTVPVVKKGRYSQCIKDVMINNHENWRHKHLNAIRSAYSKGYNFDHFYNELEAIYKRGHGMLIDLNIDLLRLCADTLGIKAPVKLASSFKVKVNGSERLQKLVQAVDGDVYLTGTDSRAYLDVELFKKVGIEVRWQEFEHPIYPQLHGDFKYMLSVIDFFLTSPEEDIQDIFNK